jgi:hypothetical protein
MPLPEPQLTMQHDEATPVRTRVRRPGRVMGRWTRLTLAVAAIGPLSLVGCQSITGSATISQIRIIDASPDAPGLDFYEGTVPITYNLGFGNVTSYIAIAPGTYNFAADSTGTKLALASASATLAPSNQYTLLISNVAASIQATVLKDQSNSAPGGQVALRFLDESVAVGAVDIYMVPTGAAITTVAPILTNQTFSANSGYVDIPVGSYKIVIYPTGTTPIATTVATYTGSTVTYSSGSAATVILLDNKILNSPALQVVTAQDYASPGASS